jgi:hypothetical protein
VVRISASPLTSIPEFRTDRLTCAGRDLQNNNKNSALAIF